MHVQPPPRSPPQNATKFPLALPKSSVSPRKPPCLPAAPTSAPHRVLAAAGHDVAEADLRHVHTRGRPFYHPQSEGEGFQQQRQQQRPGRRLGGGSAPCTGLSAQARQARAFQTAARRRARRHCACSVGPRRSEAPGPLSNKRSLRPRLSLTPPLSGPASR